MICLPPLLFWLAVFLGQVLPLYLWWPQEYPRLAKLEETEILSFDIHCLLTFLFYLDGAHELDTDEEATVPHVPDQEGL